MWTVIYMAKDENDVSLLKKALKDNNIISMVRKDDEYFEILVPSQEVSQAHSIIIDTEI
ncbi:MAG: hypothetical protein J6C82_07985 [Clostridia bacterium]|nr:hypothetical protein [Clostridia bacterium]